MDGVIRTRVGYAGGIEPNPTYHNIGGHSETIQIDYYPDKEEGFGGIVNHEVVIVGWKDDSSINNGGYWICESTWGAIFGYNGFFNIEYGALFIGILLEWADYDPNSFDWPPNTPTISGTKEGIPGNNYTYKLKSEDPDGNDDSLQYRWFIAFQQ